MIDAGLIAPAWNVQGNNSFRLVKNGYNTVLGWARVRLPAGQMLCICSFSPSGCDETCLWDGFVQDPVDQSTTMVEPFIPPLAVAHYQDSLLPPSLDISSLDNGNYQLCVNGTRPDEPLQQNCVSFAKNGQQTIIINGPGGCQMPANRPPVARCRYVEVTPGADCTATASIDNGSYDPDGDQITLTQDPPGPYLPGGNDVTLTVTDSQGLSSSCWGVVYVRVDELACMRFKTEQACLDAQIKLRAPDWANYRGYVFVPGTTPSIPTSLALDILASPDYRGLLQFYLNGILIGETANATTAPYSGYCPEVQTFTVNDAELIASAWKREGNNTIRFVKNSDGDFGWASLRLPTGTICLADFTGGNCDGSCLWSSTSNPVDQTTTMVEPFMCLAVAPYENSLLPPRLDITSLADGNYELCVTGIRIGEPLQQACLSFVKNGQPTIIINGPGGCQMPPNRPPVAKCRDVAVSVTPGADCTAAASIDKGSYDPDGDPITITQNPPGPYPIGSTPVTLAVTDSLGLSSSCQGVVTVADRTPPLIHCPADMTVAADQGQCSAVVSYTVTGEDCSGGTLTCDPPSGSIFGKGTTTVLCTAVDGLGNSSRRTFTVTVEDREPPTVVCPADIVTTVAHGLVVAGDLLIDCHYLRGIETATGIVGAETSVTNWVNYGTAGGSFCQVVSSAYQPTMGRGFTNPPYLGTWGGIQAPSSPGSRMLVASFPTPPQMYGQTGGVGNPYTIELWVWKNLADTDQRGAFAWTQNLNPEGGDAGKFCTGNPAVLHNNGKNLNYGANTPPPRNQWIHLAVTYDGATETIYTNGVMNSSHAVNLNINGHNFTPYNGRVISDYYPMLFSGIVESAPFQSSFSLNGGIAVVRVHSAALSAGDVLNNYNAGMSAIPGLPSQCARMVSFKPGVTDNCDSGAQVTQVNMMFNFNDGQVPAGTAVNGYARVADDGTGTNGVLHLTDAGQYGGNGVFVIPSQTQSRNLKEVSIHWRSLVGGAPAGADGYSFNWGTDLATSGVGEEGTGTGLSVTVDTWDNGGGEAPGLEIKWRGVRAAFDNIDPDPGLAKDFLRKNQFVEASLAVTAGGLVTFTYDGRAISAQLADWAGIASGSFVFGARTGGGADNHWIDDLIIPKSSPQTEAAVVCDPPAGSAFPVGTTPVTCTATDSSGNSSSCSFNVTVLGTISGRKFYDANANGTQDSGEPGISGWKITGTDSGGGIATTYTDGNGDYLFDAPVGTYTVTEVAPNANWVATTPASRQIEVTREACHQVCLFGNVCINPPSSGFTPGYWSNPNGKAVLSANDTAWRTLLNGCNLRNLDGSSYLVPSGLFSTVYGNFRTWLLNATAKNMASMLSAQLAATTLDVQYKGLSDSSALVVPACLTTSAGANVVDTLQLPIITGPLGLPTCAGKSCASGNGYITLGTLRALAKASLLANGNTSRASAARTYQECLKVLLDQINNNGNPPAPSSYNCPLTQVISPAAAGCPFTSPY